MDILINHWHCIIPAVVMLLAMFFLCGNDNDKNQNEENKDTHES